MSNLIMINGKVFPSYREFILSESIAPSPIDYGTDLHNDKWSSIVDDDHNEYLYTFFEKNNFYYRIYINKIEGIIGFGVSDEFDVTKNYDLEYIITNFSDDRKKTSGALYIFNHVLYILLEGIKKTNLTHIKFNSANIALGKIYMLMVKNKTLINILAELGFVYTGETEDEYLHFEKLK